MRYPLESYHPFYGTVKACGIREGEAYRMFVHKKGGVCLIPLKCLELMEEEK